MRTYVRMVVCVYIPRFELVVAAGEGSQIARQTLAGRALAVAPLVGGEQRVGEVSGAAEAQRRGAGDGPRRGARPLPRAGARAGRPRAGGGGVGADARALESIGAAVEPAGPGLAYFESDGLRGIHGTQEQTIAAAARAGRSVLGKRPVRIGAGPTRFCALAAALAVRSRRPLVLDGERGPALARRAPGRAAGLPPGHGRAGRSRSRAWGCARSAS